MPLVLVVVAIILVVVCFQLMAHPASASRLRAFHGRNGLAPAPATDTYVIAQLARRRRYRVIGAVVGMIASGVSTLAQSKVSVSFTWLLGGWFVGAVLAELTATAGAAPIDLVSRKWLRRVPYAIAIGAVVWTVAALVAKPPAASGAHLIGWGAAALACAGVIAVTVGQILRRTVPDEVDDATDRALRADAIAAITGGGTTLAILYLLHEVTLLAGAVTSEEAQGLDRAGVTWSIGAIVLGLILGLAGRPGHDADDNPVEPAGTRKYAALAVAVILVLTSGTFVAYYAGKGHAPYQPSALHAHATIRFTNDDAFTRDQTALGITGLSALDPGQGAVAFIGRVDYTVPSNAPGDGIYWIVVIDKRTDTAVKAIWGPSGSGWDPGLDTLPARYPWLQMLEPEDDGFGGVTEDNSAASTTATRTAPFGFEGLVSGDDSLTQADLEVVLAFEGPDHQIYWATRVPTTS